MVYNALELKLESITNTIVMLEKENKKENEPIIETLKKERDDILKEFNIN